MRLVTCTIGKPREMPQAAASTGRRHRKREIVNNAVRRVSESRQLNKETDIPIAGTKLAFFGAFHCCDMANLEGGRGRRAVLIDQAGDCALDSMRDHLEN